MVIRDDNPGEFYEIDRWESGVGWMIHPEETFQRASHALATERGVYVVDPLDCEQLDNRLAALGTVVGVVVLCGLHTRDTGPIARRYDVPVYLPEWVEKVSPQLPDSVERERLSGGDTLPGSGYELLKIIESRLSSEAALWHPEERTLVVGDVLQTVPWQLVADEQLAVLFGWRLLPPREQLEDLSPRRVLTGHGEGVFEHADQALQNALGGARRRAPRFFLRNLPTVVRVMWTSFMK